MSRVAGIVQVVYRAGARSRARSSPLSSCSSSSSSSALLSSVPAAFTSAKVGHHDIYARHFHTSRSTLRKNKRSALARHEAKMEQIEHEKVVEERKAKKQMEAEHKLARKKGMVPKHEEEDEITFEGIPYYIPIVIFYRLQGIPTILILIAVLWYVIVKQ